MKIRVWRGKDRSKTAPVDRKTPMTEVQGLPVRVTTYQAATRSHGAEAVVIVSRGQIRSVVVWGGEMDLYLSARAEFRCILPDPPKAEKTVEVHCSACVAGRHEDCENLSERRAVDQWCECVHGGDEYVSAIGGGK